MSWASRRRSIYFLIILIVIAVFLAPVLFFIFNQPATCTDQKQNGTETGIDCGGVCERMCLGEALDTVLLWSRSFRVTDGVYNAVAYVENPNVDATISKVSYVFKLFDSENLLITQRTGSTFISPNSISPIFEGAIRTGDRKPAKTFFEFSEIPQWFRSEQSEDFLSISDKVLSGVDSTPRIDAVLSNSSVRDVQDVEVVAVIFDIRDNATAVSSTYIDLLPRQSSTDVVFTWPQPLTKELEICAAPVTVTLLLDTSGSMNDDGGIPPQPITDAKKAAQEFVSRLTKDDRSGLITFATDSLIVQTFTSLHDTTISSIDSVHILPEEEVGFTNIGAGIKNAVDEFVAGRGVTTSIKENGSRNVIVLLTDGKANKPSDPGGEEYALLHARNAKENNITIYTIGLGDKINTDFLKELASRNTESGVEHFYKAATSKELNSIYRQISEDICERGPAVIEIIPRLDK